MWGVCGGLAVHVGREICFLAGGGRQESTWVERVQQHVARGWSNAEAAGKLLGVARRHTHWYENAKSQRDQAPTPAPAPATHDDDGPSGQGDAAVSDACVPHLLGGMGE